MQSLILKKLITDFNDFLIWLYILIEFRIHSLRIVFQSKKNLEYWVQSLNIMCIQPNCWTVNFLFLNSQHSASQLFSIEQRFKSLDFVASCVPLVYLLYLLWQFFSCMSASDSGKMKRKRKIILNFLSNQDAAMHKATKDTHNKTMARY